VDVASTTHKHSVEHTPAGSVSSTFSGTQATLTAPASSSTVSVNSMTGKGSLPTYTTVDVASTTHKHSVEHTPAGSVSSSFTGKNKSTSGPSITTPVADEVKP
jgi:hypothetical protein